MKKNMQKLLVTTAVMIFLSTFPQAGHAGKVEEQIETIVQAIGSGNQPTLAGAMIDAKDAIPELYDLRGYRPIWFGNGSADDLLQQLGSGLDQGFRPPDFHLPLLLELFDRAQNGTAEDKSWYVLILFERQEQALLCCK